MNTIQFNVTDASNLKIPFSSFLGEKSISKIVTIEFLLNKDILTDFRLPFSVKVSPNQPGFIFFLGPNGLISDDKRFGSKSFKNAGDVITREFCFISEDNYDENFKNKIFNINLYYHSKYGREACDSITLMTK